MAEFICMDKSGRIVLPKRLRKRLKAAKFTARMHGDNVVLEPLLSLDELVGSAPKLNRKKLFAEHMEEIRRENRN